MQASLYMKYGSRMTTGLSELIYDRLLADPELAPFFKDIDIDVLREHMADFLGVVTGGPNIYQGRDIREAHAGLAITDDHFDRLLAHLDAATHMLGIEPADIETLLDIVRSTRDDVVMV